MNKTEVELTGEQIGELHRDGYSCGDCTNFENCKCNGITLWCFICNKFSLD